MSGLEAPEAVGERGNVGFGRRWRIGRQVAERDQQTVQRCRAVVGFAPLRRRHDGQVAERAVRRQLIESAKLNGHDPWAYLKDVFERLPTLKNRDLAQLLPHNWRPASAIVEPGPVAATA